MKFGQILYDKFLTRFWLHARDRKLVPDLLMILLKWQYIEIWPFWIVSIYHSSCPYSPFQKNETLEYDLIGYWVIGAGC